MLRGVESGLARAPEDCDDQDHGMLEQTCRKSTLCNDWRKNVGNEWGMTKVETEC